MDQIIKFPRTPHIKGSNIQIGDEDLKQISFDLLKGKKIIVEEKIDGANTAISFNSNGDLLLQSRGHLLTGGNREKHYSLFKQWAYTLKDQLYSVLKDQYILYGEWMYAKHTVYYDQLPHYFFEFDIYDKDNKKFLDTKSRKELIKNLPIISVPILKEDSFNSLEELIQLISKSNLISSHNKLSLMNSVEELGLDPELIIKQTDLSGIMEGLYIKLEEDGEVKLRAKYVKPNFTQLLNSSEEHWLERPIIPNELSITIEDLFDYE